MTPSATTSTAKTPALPALRRLAGWLAVRAACGLVAQGLLWGVGVALLAWGLLTGLARVETAWPPAVMVGVATAGVWIYRGRPRLAAARLIAQAERTLHLHELFTTAWTLPAAAANASAEASANASANALASTAPGVEFRAQIEARAEAAAQAAQPADLLPLRLPAYWNLALALAVIGVGAGLRPQPEAGFMDADRSQLAAAAGEDDPLGGGGTAGARQPDAMPPADLAPKPLPRQTVQLTTAQADLQKQWQELAAKLDTPEKLNAALAQFALLQQQQVLPADAIRAIEERLREREKALQAAGSQPGGKPVVTPTPPVGPHGEGFVAIPLTSDGHTMNPTILQEIRVRYPEYEPALTRYVRWLAEHGTPTEATEHGTR